MSSSEPVNIVVRTGRAGRYADRRITPELLQSWRGQSLCTGLPETDRRRRPAHP